MVLSVDVFDGDKTHLSYVTYSNSVVSSIVPWNVAVIQNVWFLNISQVTDTWLNDKMCCLGNINTRSQYILGLISLTSRSYDMPVQPSQAW